MGADVIALLDALGLERVALVGHSFGSFVARQTAIAHSIGPSVPTKQKFASSPSPEKSTFSRLPARSAAS